MTEESIDIILRMDSDQDNEAMKKSKQRGSLFQAMKFSSEKMKIHADSDKFNDAINMSNYEGKHEEICNLLRAGSKDSSLSIIIFTIHLILFNMYFRIMEYS